MSKGYDVITADTDPAARNYVTGEARTNFYQVDCREPPKEWISRFDFITIISTLEHLTVEDASKMAHALANCLTDNGTMIITVPYGTGTKMQGQWQVECYNEQTIEILTSLKLYSYKVFTPSIYLPIAAMRLKK
jgi:2-polyprenyl-3-methyl-5-hydroxy-6-metoxy-1,4-benzoquinol methylase